MIPADFQFSQNNLQDFVDCRRRFQLRYLIQLAWPAVESEPVLARERFIQQGAWFHRLVQQHQLGLPVERLTALIHDEDLARWWDHYLHAIPALIGAGGQRYPESSLTAPLAGYRLAARYDLVVVESGGRLLILDWKTNHKRPRNEFLAERIQTRLYPYLLVRAGGLLWNKCTAGKDFEHGVGEAVIAPEQVEMIYWFADYPDQPLHLHYTQAQFETDEAYLAGLINQIARLNDLEFDLTTIPTRCAYCVYRSLCERGISAGDLTQVEVDWQTESGVEFVAGFNPQLDFDQIAEIEF